MKYLVYYNEKFNEFNNWADTEYFLLDKPKNVKWKKITSKKMEKEFREGCLLHPTFQKKIYVIIDDERVKRFENWKDCENYKNQHKNAKFKGFESEEEAQAFINANTRGRVSKDTIRCVIKNLGKNDIGDACVLLKEDNLLKTFNINELKATTINSRECEAIIKAVEWAIKYNEECILIEYRNQGSEMWANGSWKTNADFAKKYKAKINELKTKINIEFREQK